jgi:hypothetical protein
VPARIPQLSDVGELLANELDDYAAWRKRKRYRSLTGVGELGRLLFDLGRVGFSFHRKEKRNTRRLLGPIGRMPTWYRGTSAGHIAAHRAYPALMCCRKSPKAGP